MEFCLWVFNIFYARLCVCAHACVCVCLYFYLQTKRVARNSARPLCPPILGPCSGFFTWRLSLHSFPYVWLPPGLWACLSLMVCGQFPHWPTEWKRPRGARGGWGPGESPGVSCHDQDDMPAPIPLEPCVSEVDWFLHFPMIRPRSARWFPATSGHSVHCLSAAWIRSVCRLPAASGSRGSRLFSSVKPPFVFLNALPASPSSCKTRQHYNYCIMFLEHLVTDYLLHSGPPAVLGPRNLPGYLCPSDLLLQHGVQHKDFSAT